MFHALKALSLRPAWADPTHTKLCEALPHAFERSFTLHTQSYDKVARAHNLTKLSQEQPHLPTQDKSAMKISSLYAQIRYSGEKKKKTLVHFWSSSDTEEKHRANVFEPYMEAVLQKICLLKIM